MIRFVLDTNIVVSGLLWNGSPRRLLHLAAEEKILLYTSASLIAELTTTLARSKFEKKVTAAILPVGQIIGFYLDLVSIVLPVPTARLAPDPDDDIVIGTAISAKAGLLVTGDRSLLSVAFFEGGLIVSVHQALDVYGEPSPVN